MLLLLLLLLSLVYFVLIIKCFLFEQFNNFKPTDFKRLTFSFWFFSLLEGVEVRGARRWLCHSVTSQGQTMTPNFRHLYRVSGRAGAVLYIVEYHCCCCALKKSRRKRKMGWKHSEWKRYCHWRAVSIKYAFHVSQHVQAYFLVLVSLAAHMFTNNHFKVQVYSPDKIPQFLWALSLFASFKMTFN